MTSRESKHASPPEILRAVENSPLLLKEAKSIWYTADLHDSHPKIVGIHDRPIANEDHREWLISVINTYVDKKHRLYLLGDISFASKTDAERHFLSRLNGKKILIPGNHDRNIEKSTCFSEIKTRKNFNFSRNEVNIHIVLDHYPIASWERKVYDSWHLHGHTHCQFVNCGLSWDVGIDRKGLWRPYSLYDICKIMAWKYEGESEPDIVQMLLQTD